MTSVEHVLIEGRQVRLQTGVDVDIAHDLAASLRMDDVFPPARTERERRATDRQKLAREDSALDLTKRIIKLHEIARRTGHPPELLAELRSLAQDLAEVQWGEGTVVTWEEGTVTVEHLDGRRRAFSFSP